MRDAVVAWLDSDPLMARLAAGNADARHLTAAYDRLLPVLAAALHVVRAAPSLDVSGPQYTYTGSSVLQTSHDDLQRRLAERDVVIDDLRDHLSRETKSSEAASAIADELSVALEASRALVADRDDHLLAIRTALDCDDGATTIVAEIVRLKAEHMELRRDNADHRDAVASAAGMTRTPVPFRRSGAPQPLVPENELQLGAARIRELEATLNTERQQHALDMEDLRDRMADPEGMSHALRVHPLEGR